jgi:hypothetical protein
MGVMTIHIDGKSKQPAWSEAQCGGRPIDSANVAPDCASLHPGYESV